MRRLNLISRQCRSIVELTQLGSSAEKYGVCTRPKVSSWSIWQPTSHFIFPVRRDSLNIIHVINLLCQKSLIFIINHYLYTVKNSSGAINSNTMTNILKPKNPNPNIILTYNNVPLLEKPDSHECRVFKNYDREGV